MAQRVILAIDEGTTNSKVVLVDAGGKIIASGSAPVPITHPQSGWVQQDAKEIWAATSHAIASCLRQAPKVQIVAIGISNQRESILIWDRKTGQPLGPVVTWQCRRTAAACDALRDAGHEQALSPRPACPWTRCFRPPRRLG